MTARLTVVEHVYFSDANGVDRSVDLAHGLDIETEEQMWQRTASVGPEPRRKNTAISAQAVLRLGLEHNGTGSVAEKHAS